MYAKQAEHAYKCLPWIFDQFFDFDGLKMLGIEDQDSSNGS